MVILQSHELNIQFKSYTGQIARICEDFHIDSLKSQIAALCETLEESNLINIALVGGFKTGKSSFLNSLIGRDIMPVAVLPLTSVITYAQYGPEDKATVRLLNGQTKTISLQELADYITEKSNPENVKQVDKVDVELSNLQTYKGIRFVDTPGFGSAYKHNTLTSTGWLPKVGAAFLAVNVTNPFSEADILLFKELDAYTPEIIILLTKTDLISAKEADEVVKFIREQVKKHLNKDVKILPFSNKPGFESIRNSVYEYIQKTIADDQVRKSSEIISHKFRSILTKCREYLELALSAANSVQESRQQLFRLLAVERQRFPEIKREIWLISSGIKARVQTDSSDIFHKKYLPVKDKLVNELKEQIPNWNGNLAETSTAFRSWAKDNLTRELEIISQENGLQLTGRHLRPALDSFSRIVRAFQDRMASDIENAFKTKFSGASFDARVEKPKEPDVQVGNVFMTPWEIIWYLIPMRLFRPLVTRHFLRLIPWETEKNLYRLGSQWYETISRSIDQMAQQAEEFIQNEINTVENILTEAPDQQKEIEKAIIDLEQMKNDEKTS